jgi:hypothetical protein
MLSPSNPCPNCGQDRITEPGREGIWCDDCLAGKYLQRESETVRLFEPRQPPAIRGQGEMFDN